MEDPHSDFPTTMANIASTSNYVAVHVTGLSPYNPDTNPSNEGRLNYGFIGMNATSILPINFNNRAYCSYFMVSTNFTCLQFGTSLQGAFFLKVRSAHLKEALSSPELTSTAISLSALRRPTAQLRV